MPSTDRDNWLAHSDAELLAECAVDTYRASGPGGQKRNKTSSAVRLRHQPSGVIVIAEESRSQHENKARALRRLRMAIALEVRRSIDPPWSPPPAWRNHVTPTGRIEISTRHRAYAMIVALILDAMEASGGAVRDAAALLGVGTAQLSRFIAANPKVMAAANRLRKQHNLRPLTA